MPDSQREFLGLTAAASQLGVHPATLRRWADQGDVLCVVTPGGHRRFLRSEIESLLHRREDDGNVADDLIESALISTRNEIDQLRDTRWLSSMSEAQRGELRQEGRKVMELLRAYVDESTDRADILDKLRDIGASYAQSARQAQLTLKELLEAISFFRSHILETTVDDTALSNDGRRELFRNVNVFLNALLLSVAEMFESS
ncbi:MAG: helix-turn-helix domain-containing protein [Bacteroidetes bacterium]|nr:helix-turn-helix domain-containing protein [Bacteroidota bacterium]